MFYILETAPPVGENHLNIILLVLILAIFYFLMVRPQTKKRNELKNFRSNLSKGDEVITQGGIHGNISSVAENTVNLNIDGNTKIKVEKEMVFPNSSSINK